MATNKATSSSKSNFDSLDKIFSNTLKRNPKMELNKTDLLKLLTYLEGELQAREIVIATLKAERVKQLLYQAKYGQFSLNDPFAALQRDSYGAYNPSCDEASIKAMYNNQLSQVENLILQHRRAQQRLRQHLFDAEQQHAKVVSDLEDEIRKHAHDTAQGDDVAYMLEKERERLHQEIELERQQNKKLEKELKKVVQALEQDKLRHKQIVMLLLEDRKRIITKLLEIHSRNEEMTQYLTSEKGRMADVVEGLEEESKKSLQMEAELERQAGEFVTEREQLKRSLQQTMEENRQLRDSVAKLCRELTDARSQQQYMESEDEDLLRVLESEVNAHELRTRTNTSSNSPPSSTNAAVTSPPAPPVKPAILIGKVSPFPSPTAVSGGSPPKLALVKGSNSTSPVPPPVISPQHSSTLTVTGIGNSTPTPQNQSSTIVRTVRSITPTPPSQTATSSGTNHAGTSNEKSVVRSVVTAISSGAASPPPPTSHVVQVTPRVSLSTSPGTRVYTTTQGGKVTFHVSAPPQPPKKPPQLAAVVAAAGATRGAPPPIPPNKPVLQRKEPFAQHAGITATTTTSTAVVSGGGMAPVKMTATPIPGGGLKFGITISKTSESQAANQVNCASSPSSAPHLVMSSSSSSTTTVGGATVVAATSTPAASAVTEDSSAAPQVFKETQPVYITAVADHVLNRHIQYLNLSPRKSENSPPVYQPLYYTSTISASEFQTKQRADDCYRDDPATEVLAPELADFQQLLVSMETLPSSGLVTDNSLTVVSSSDKVFPSSTVRSDGGSEAVNLRSGSPMGRLSAMLEQWKLERNSRTPTATQTLEYKSEETVEVCENRSSQSKRPKLTPVRNGGSTTKSTLAEKRTSNFNPRVRKVVSPTLPKSFNNMKL